MIDQRLVQMALELVDPASFEKFGQTFYGALQDREFVPLGGMHDGGAEGFTENSDIADVLEDEGATSFLQVSKQVTTRQKIRNTVKRLREYGRTPKVLTYITSEKVDKIDTEESYLSGELHCKIKIRDRIFIEQNINSSSIIQSAFNSFLLPHISHLMSPGISNMGERSSAYTDRTLAVFLRQEVDNRRSKSGLLESVVDSLILWALGDTDPDKGIFLDRNKILAKIESTLPSSKQFIRGVIDVRLDALKSKNAPGGRQIRWYPQARHYCLPYDTRLIIAAENAEDDILKMRVSCAFEDRISELSPDFDDEKRADAVALCHETLERAFEEQGLQVAQFASNSECDDSLYTDVSEIVSKICQSKDWNPEYRDFIRRTCLLVLRGTFYRSSEEERIYLQKLSRTYILLMLLKNEPKIVEYFRSVAKSFNLYLGTDILIRAISEHYLSEESKTTVNLMKILKASGATLIITEKTIEEVATHLRRQMIEFEFNYAPIENKIQYSIVEYIDRLLIRAYFYARLSPVGGVSAPENWRDYMSQFANYGDIRNNRGDKELASYLINKFGLTYENSDELLHELDNEEIDELTSSIQQAKGKTDDDDDILAYNDALHVLRIYQRRKELKESSPANPFGFRTWWLTQDGKVRRAAAITVKKHGGKFFMMRPEFILNYISIAPELEDVRKSYGKIFPTALGVRLSARLSKDVFNNVISSAARISKVDDARAGAMITALTDELKGDAVRLYENKWESSV